MGLSPALSVAGGRRARHGGAAEQIGGRVALSAGGRLPLSAINTLVWQGSLQGAAGRGRAREQRLQTGTERHQSEESGEK